MAARTLDLLDDLVAHGRAAITTAEAADALAIPEDQVRVRMHRYVEQGRVIAPARGL
jgi:DNA-directed RNA polymerase specialized sigma24 family protein